MSARTVRLPRRVLALALLLVAPPLAGEAQQQAKIARIGYLSPVSATTDASRMDAFRRGLHALGHAEGKHVLIEARYAEESRDRLPDLARDLVRLNVDVIVTSTAAGVRAAQDATRTIPIVMAFTGDPVGEGFVQSLARPGANITGHSGALTEIATKRVGLLKACVPKLSHVTVLLPRGAPRAGFTETEAAARAVGVKVTSVIVTTSADVDQAFATMQKSRVNGVIVSLALQENWNQILALALKSRLPTISGPREFAEAGGLMAYGPNYDDLFRRTATYVDRILKGAKPADLPVERPTKFDLVINQGTAKRLGLTIPHSTLVQAEQVGAR